MPAKFKLDYDEEEDLLYLYDERKKASGSVEFGDLIIDLEKGGRVVGMEIFGASEYLSELTNKKITKQDIKKIQSAAFTFTARNGTMIIRIILPIKKEEVPATIAIQDINYTSPAMAYAE